MPWQFQQAYFLADKNLVINSAISTTYGVNQYLTGEKMAKSGSTVHSQFTTSNVFGN